MAGSDAMQNIGSAIGGGPTAKQVNSNMQYLQGPQASNYQIGGLGQYENQTQGLASGAQAADQAFQQNASGLGTYNSGLAGQGAAQQNSAFNSLQNLANGNGPSLAAKNLQAGLNSTNSALQSQAMSSAGGAGAGNSQRNLLNAQTAAANNASQAAGQASTAEQLGATGQLSNAADSMRASNLQQAAAAAGAGATLRGQNLASTQNSQNTQLNALNSGIAAQEQQTQNNMTMDAGLQQLGNEKAQIGQAATDAGAASGGALGKFGTDLIKSGVQGAAGILSGGLSDKNAKTDIKDTQPSTMQRFFGSLAHTMAPPKSTQPQTPVESIGTGLGQIVGSKVAESQAMGRAEDAQDAALEKWRAGLSDENQKTDVRSQTFMDHLEPKSFEYKNPDAPGASHGTVHGVMAQDMEKSPLGAAMVHDTSQGKMYDMPKAVSATLNGLATLNQRIDELEKMKRGRA